MRCVCALFGCVSCVCAIHYHQFSLNIYPYTAYKGQGKCYYELKHLIGTCLSKYCFLNFIKKHKSKQENIVNMCYRLYTATLNPTDDHSSI